MPNYAAGKTPVGKSQRKCSGDAGTFKPVSEPDEQPCAHEAGEAGDDISPVEDTVRQPELGHLDDDGKRSEGPEVKRATTEAGETEKTEDEKSRGIAQHAVPIGPAAEPRRDPDNLADEGRRAQRKIRQGRSTQNRANGGEQAEETRRRRRHGRCRRARAGRAARRDRADWRGRGPRRRCRAAGGWRRIRGQNHGA